MNIKFDIENVNALGRLHGYQEWYTSINAIWFRGNFVNGKRIGYCEDRFSSAGSVYYNAFYIR